MLEVCENGEKSCRGVGRYDRAPEVVVKAVVQRVGEASVTVDGEVVGEIGPGLLILVGAEADDTEADAVAVADKLAGLRIFRDGDGRMNRSIVDVGGAALVVSQFTLLADVRRGRRPSFTRAAPPEIAEPLVAALAADLRTRGIPVAEGRFGAMMDVRLLNDGPVTIVVETAGGRVR
jgi:D-tyrosyl-tRNA(Tyr) deacylase